MAFKLGPEITEPSVAHGTQTTSQEIRAARSPEPAGIHLLRISARVWFSRESRNNDGPSSPKSKILQRLRKSPEIAPRNGRGAHRISRLVRTVIRNGTESRKHRRLELTDLQLVAAIRAGDARAGDELVRRHLAAVRNLLFQMVLDSHLADDLTQETFSRAWQSFTTYRGDSTFSTWLHRIALNTAYEHLRNLPRRRCQTLPDDAADSRTSAPPLTRDDGDRITRALAQLPASLRAAIVLTVMQGYSAAEAAQVEGCSLGTMYWRVHSARQRLKRELEDDFG